MACATDLSGKHVRMRTYALANDNHMVREPMAFRTSDGARLTPVTFCMLSLARMAVQKIIAEKDRQADPKTKQRGHRANTSCLPQAIVKESVTDQLPAVTEKTRRFFSDSRCIVLVGCNPDDLVRAVWTEVPRDAYLTAVRFLIAHSEAYHQLRLHENTAREGLLECGRTCQELCEQATMLRSTERVAVKLDAPGDVEGPEITVDHRILGETDAETKHAVDWQAEPSNRNAHPPSSLSLLLSAVALHVRTQHR